MRTHPPHVDLPALQSADGCSGDAGLFPDVLKNMQTDDLEQKKLVYLCVISFTLLARFDELTTPTRMQLPHEFCQDCEIASV